MTTLERRVEFRKGLHALYLPYYDSLCAHLVLENWAPYFGIRTFDEQAKLYAQGRTTPGKIVTHAPPGASAHEYGCATDWAYFTDGRLIWLDAHDSKWNEYFQAGVLAGVQLGAKFHLPDTDHNELKIAHSWSQVLKVYNTQGPDEATKFIEKSHAFAIEDMTHAP